MSAESNILHEGLRTPASATGSTIDARRLLALDTLSHLIEQGLRNPTLSSLFAELLMSLAGQFTVSSSAAIIATPEEGERKYRVIRFGDCAGQEPLSELSVSIATAAHFVADNRISYLNDIHDLGLDDELLSILTKLKITIVCPLVSEQTFYGLVGLGTRVTRKAYQPDDLVLLKTLVNTVTPLVANVFLFQRLSLMNTWHLEILNSVKQAVYVFDYRLILRKLNSAALQMLQRLKISGDSLEDLVGLGIDQVFPMNQCPGWESAIMRFVASESSARDDCMILTSANTELLYNVRMSNVPGQSAAFKDLAITFEDVTQLKQNEQRLYDLALFADKAQMTSSIVHELNNYLAIISAQASVARHDFMVERNSDGLVRLDRLIEDIFKMRRYTGGLLDFGKIKSAKTMTNLGSLVEKLFPFMRVQKKFAGIELQSRIDQHLPEVFVDPDQMTQVFLNLFNNAADAIKEAKRTNGTIEVQVRTDGDDVAASVRDNGVGMSEEIRAMLFKDSITTKKQGHGYGLMTCGRILNDHDAVIDIQSVPNEGTTFKISLPHTHKEAEAPAEST